ncbi:MAG TPA: TonB-dependent receptor [Bacteroidia bacterium]|jgi:outer membrane receptor for ferrienterochelin and colicin|nr:TonB-dependent receptor [Bacteroidia bacterium]
MGWGQILNNPTAYLGLPSSGYNNAGTAGVLAENFRGEKPSRYEPYSRTGFIQNTYTINSKWSLFTLGEYRETGVNEKSYAYITIDGKNLYRLPFARYSNRWGGKISTSYKLSSKHKISGGVEFYQDNLEDGNRKIEIDTNKYIVNGQFVVMGLYSTFLARKFIIWNNFGSFLQYELHTKWLKETNFIIGTRYDISSVYGNPLSPRIAIVNRSSDKLTLKLLYGVAYRAPTITEVEEYRSNLGSRNSLSNENLKPEKVRTYELNVIYKLNVIYNPVKELLFQLNAFRNELTNIIVLTELQIGGFTQNQNLGEAYVNGIETRFDASISKKINGFVNFTLQNGEQTAIRFAKNDTTFGIPNIARVKGNIGLTVHVAELFNISLIGNWVGERRVLGYNPYGTVPGYFVTNCAITTLPFFNNHVRVSLTIKNLFNVKYLDPGIRAADGLLYSTVLEQPGLTGIFKITASF